MTQFSGSHFPLSRIAIALLSALAIAACSGGGSRGDSGNNNGDDDDDGGGGTGKGTAPTAILSPVGELGMNEALTITFSESMDTGSVTLGGSLVANALTEWRSVEADDDTLVLRPADSWEAGVRTLQVEGRDTDGDVLATVEANYIVLAVVADFVAADIVIGQADFDSGNAHQGGAADANTLANPVGGAAYAVNEDILFIADTGSARVLGFNGIPATNNANADFVIGQPDFTSTAGAVSASGMQAPQMPSATHGALVVTDTPSHRVLIYDAIPASGPADAAVVVGQPDLLSASTGCAATSLNAPASHFVTPDGKLIVADSGNNRVLIWNELPQANATAPDIVLGQNDFSHCTANDDDQDSTPSPDWPPHAYTLHNPTGIWSDGEKLIVADSGNHRVLIWETFPAENFAPADHLLGQNSFRRMAANDTDQDGATDAGGVTSERVFDYPVGVWSTGRQIFVADRNNNRVLVWNAFPTRFFTGADAVIGQQGFVNNAANDANQDDASDARPSLTTLNAPTGVAMIGDRLIVTDSGNSRVLIYKSE